MASSPAEVDQRINPKSELTVVSAVRSYIHEARMARRGRQIKNKINRSAYFNEQDWSHKVAGQSKEFLPKTAVTTEQFSAFIKRGLTQFGEWFQVEAPGSPISPGTIVKLMSCFLEKLPDKGSTTIDFATRLADGTKIATLEGEMVLKVHGRLMDQPKIVSERGKPVVDRDFKTWRLLIDLVRNEDFFKDPTGRGLYRIHRCERDLADVVKMAKEGVYNAEVVAQVVEDAIRDQEDRRRQIDKDTQSVPVFRKRCFVDEFWGTFLSPTGRIVKENVFCTVLNDKWLIREPTPWPFWHGEDPFIEIPLIRVPFEEYNAKALADDGVPLNLAINELFNLMLDGGIASVWGIKQLHTHYVAHPEQLAGGIPQGKTIEVAENTPPGFKVLEQVAEGEVPQDAMAMYALVDREFQAAMKTNDLKLGFLPPRQVKATEVVEASQSSAVVLDAMVVDMETRLTKMLEKTWALILQNIDSVDPSHLRHAMTDREIVRFIRMPAEERFELMLEGCQFRARGLSATLAKARDFQRLMAILQVATSSPVLMPAFLRKISPDKVISQLWRMSNLNPTDFERSEEDLQNAQGDIAMLPQLLSLQGPGGRANAEAVGEPGLPSEINQEQSQTSGV